jgi:hypothetical protein
VYVLFKLPRKAWNSVLTFHTLKNSFSFLLNP